MVIVKVPVVKSKNDDTTHAIEESPANNQELKSILDKHREGEFLKSYKNEKDNATKDSLKEIKPMFTQTNCNKSLQVNLNSSLNKDSKSIKTTTIQHTQSQSNLVNEFEQGNSFVEEKNIVQENKSSNISTNVEENIITSDCNKTYISNDVSKCITPNIIDLTKDNLSDEENVIPVKISNQRDFAKNCNLSIDTSDLINRKISVIDLTIEKESELENIIDLTTPEQSFVDLTIVCSDDSVKGIELGDNNSDNTVGVINVSDEELNRNTVGIVSPEKKSVSAIKQQLMNGLSNSKQEQLSMRQRVEEDVNSVIMCDSVMNLIRKFA